MKISSSLAKLYGELAELRFLLKCRELGLLVSKLEPFCRRERSRGPQSTRFSCAGVGSGSWQAKS